MATFTIRRGARRLALGLALLALLSWAVPVSAGSKTPDGVGCDVYPGTTSIHWSPKAGWARITFNWLDDATGAIVGQIVEIPTKGSGSFSAPTPQFDGQLGWVFKFYTRRGDMTGIAGGICQ